MKNVIITGASRGIGFELVQLFAKNNCNVLAISRNINSLEKLNISNLTSLSADVSDKNDIEKIRELLKSNVIIQKVEAAVGPL